MPVLINTPDIMADTLLGAAGWAAGSQTCSGMMPAFVPKPARKSRNAAFREAGVIRSPIA